MRRTSTASARGLSPLAICARAPMLLPIHAEHPDRPRELIEISLRSWFEHRVPESGSERQINELDRLFGPWIRDRERKSRAAKK